MFCSQCGTKNQSGTTYCVNDGAPLTTLSTGAQVSRSNSKFCRECSSENGTGATYCSTCGYSLEKIEEVKDNFFPKTGLPSRSSADSSVEDDSSYASVKDVLSKGNLIHAAKFSGIAVAILLIFSLIISSSINRNVQGLVSDELAYEFGNQIASIASNIKLIGMTDILMVSHLVGVNYSANVLFFDFFATTTAGLFIFLLVPAIVLVITGYLLNRRVPYRSMIIRFYSALSVSIVYAVILGFIGIFAGISISVPTPNEFLGEITVTASYSFIEVFFNAFVLSTLFTTIGSMIGMKKEGATLNVGYGVSIYRAMITTVVGIFIMFFVAFATFSSSDLLEEQEAPMKALVSSQLGGYYWNLAQLNSLGLELESQGESVEATYSIIGGAKTNMDREDQEEFNLFVKEFFGGFVYFSLLIPILLHLWSGNQLRKVSNGNILYELGAYAVAFGVINGVVVYISKFTIITNIEDTLYVSLGYSVLPVFIVSTIMAFAFSYIGVMITNKSSNQSAVPEDHVA